MKTLYFEDYTDFAYDIANEYEGITEKDDLESVNIIAKYYEAKEIISELIAIGYGIAFMDKFSDPEWDGYEDEFVISLHDDEIWCEPAKRNGEYIHPEAKVIYLLDNCNSKIIPMIEADEVYEVEVGEDDCDGDCENCELGTNKPNFSLDKDEDGNIHGFTLFNSDEDGYERHEFYSSDPIDYIRLFDLLSSLL